MGPERFVPISRGTLTLREQRQRSIDGLHICTLFLEFQYPAYAFFNVIVIR